jgi:hypothetical protein
MAFPGGIVTAWIAYSLVATPSIELVRVTTEPIMMPLPGVAVIRDSAAWATLWHRFERHTTRGDDGSLVRTPAPPVDFRRDMLVAVALGGLSGCSNAAQWIRRISAFADSLVVLVGPQAPGNEITCAMFIQPIDVVRIPRSRKPIVFRSLDRELVLPGAAHWWDRPTYAEVQRMVPWERAVFTMALARDPMTPWPEVAHIARAEGASSWSLSRVLFERREVRADAEAVTALANGPDWPGQEASKYLMREFGPRLAGNDSTPVASLRVLIEQLARDSTHYETARLLLQNTAVRRYQFLLRLFIRHSYYYPELLEEACRTYVSQWPVWQPMHDTRGNRASGWSSTVPCRHLMPPPSM